MKITDCIVKISCTGGEQNSDTINDTVNANGVHDMNGLSDSIDALGGGGTVTNNVASSTSTLTVGAGNGGGTFSGTIKNGAGGGVMVLAKSGIGAQAITGVQTYTGATLINNGTLAM